MDRSGSASNFPPWCHLCLRRNTCETANNFTTSLKLNVSKIVIGWCSVCFFFTVFLVTFQINPHQYSSTKKEILSHSTVIPWRLWVLFSQGYVMKSGWEEIRHEWEKPDRERWFFLPQVSASSPCRCINPLYPEACELVSMLTRWPSLHRDRTRLERAAAFWAQLNAFVLLCSPIKQ